MLEKQAVERVYFEGYCMNRMCRAQFSYPKGIVGTLYTCEFCGKIREKVGSDEDSHIFEPSKKLLRFLEQHNVSEEP